MKFTWLPNYWQSENEVPFRKCGTEVGMRTQMQTKDEASLAIFLTQCECGVKPGNKVNDALQNL